MRQRKIVWKAMCKCANMGNLLAECLHGKKSFSLSEVYELLDIVVTHPFNGAKKLKNGTNPINPNQNRLTKKERRRTRKGD